MLLNDALIDVYALLPTRSAAAVSTFLHALCPHPRSVSADYSVDDVLRLADAPPNRAAPTDFYFAPSASSAFVAAGMVHFCGDGALVVGVSIPTTSPRDTATRVTHLLEQFRDLLGARHAYALLETPPATDSTASFLAERDQAGVPCLSDGAILAVPDPDSWQGPAFLSP